MKVQTKLLSTLSIAMALVALPAMSQDMGQQTQDGMVADASSQASQQTYSQDEIINSARHFFGETSGALGQAVERVFREQGQPVGYIEGTDWNLSLGAGVRYGRGTLVMKSGEQVPVYWQGPSLGIGAGANASKVFVLVYNLGNPNAIYRRYPGVEGSAFFVAGVSGMYQKAEGVTLAPIRTGVGLQLGASVGYTAYSRTRRINPF